MNKKEKTLGLIISGAALLNVNSAVVNAKETPKNADDQIIKKTVKSSSTIKTVEEKNLPNETEDKTEKKVSFEGMYDTLEEAEERKAEKEAEYKSEGYEDIVSEINVIKDETGHEEFDHCEIVVTIDAYTDLSEEEAKELKSQLEEDENVTATIKESGEVLDPSAAEDFEEKFEDDADREAILKALEDDGYTLSDVSYEYDTDIVEETLSEVFGDKEAAEKALNDFKETHTVTEENITDVENPDKDVTETYSETFDTEEAAESFKEAEEAKTTTEVIYTAKKEEVPGETEELNETFETREAAEKAINDFESTHSVLDSESNIEERQAGTIYSSILITKDMKTYEVGHTTYVIIKHGNEHVIWTENELTEEEQNTFIESYKEHEDNVITYRKLKQSHTFTSGYGESNYSGNGKLFTFYEEDGKTYIQMASGAESRVLAGEYQPINEYVATASGHNVTYKVDVTKTTKGFDYKVDAKGTKEIILGSGTVKGKKNKPKKLYSIDLSEKIEVYKTVFDDDYKLNINGVKKEKEVVNNPETLDSITFSFITMFMSSVGLAVTSLKQRLSKKEN